MWKQFDWKVKSQSGFIVNPGKSGEVPSRNSSIKTGIEFLGYDHEYDRFWERVMGSKLNDIKFGVPWNLLLLTVGAILFVIGVNGIVVHQSFIPGGMYGLCLFIYYKTEFLSPGILFLIGNIPLCVFGWLLISRRFVLYTIYCSLVITVASEMIVFDFGIHNQLYAAIAAGCICGAGSGIILRTFGAGGGLDIVAIILYQRYNIGVGKTYLVFNMFLFLMVVANYTADILIASIILTYVTANCMDYFLSLFNQRKIVYVISDSHQKLQIA